MTRARRDAGLLLLPAFLLTGCAPREREPGDAEWATDTVSGLTYSVEASIDTLRALVTDSAVPAPVAGEAPLPATTAVSAPADATLPAPPKPDYASPADLAKLKARLIIPVKGVSAAQLHDSFKELRGGGTRAHEAIDIHAPRGTPVLAATAGRVLKVHKSMAGGLMLYTADASDRFILMYAHLDAYAPGIAEGMPLRQGQEIGTVGSTGNAPPGAPHLHFGVARGTPSLQWWRGEPANPYPLLVR